MFQNRGQLFKLILKYNLCLLSYSNIWHGLFTFACDSNGKKGVVSNWLHFCFSWLNPIQAGVFWNHIGWGAHCAPPSLFLLYLLSCYYQTWHGGTVRQNLSEAIKIFLMSSLGGKYDVIKLFLVSFEVKIRVPLSFVQWSWNLAQGVNSEVLILNWSQKLRYKYVLKEKNAFFKKKWNFWPSPPWQITILPWQHPMLLLPENYFKWYPI